MNFFTSRNDILSLPLTEQERTHTSRQRHAYHVFLSQFCTKYKALSIQQKKDLLIELRVMRPDAHDFDDSDEDSVLTVAMPAAGDIMRAASKVWRDSGLDLKAAWRERANRLNLRPPNNGNFEAVPDYVNDEVLIESLSGEWKYLVSILKLSTTMNITKWRPTSISTYVYGNERVTVDSQNYRTFFISHLLKLSIFGSPLYSKLLDHEIMYRRRRETIVFIYSHRRMSELFTFGGLSGAEFYKNGLKYVSCAKVNLRDRRGRNIIGYVMDEDRVSLKMKVEGEDDLIVIRRPEYDTHDGRFLYNTANVRQRGSYEMTQLWPIRMKLNNSGQSNYMLSAYSYVDDEVPDEMEAWI
mmetsp:Transcript_1879/g.2260  ORF Transcript_1879/g.2260 Transcript_1879/m.2260 type:complete len:354 (+) Transcript_1879:1312-2373(+)